MFKKFETASILSWLIVIALIACNGFLIRQNLRLRGMVDELNSERTVKIGDEFTDFKAFDTENKPLNFGLSKNKKVILFTSTSYPFCKKQNPYWLQMLQQLDARKYETVEIFNAAEERPTVSNYVNSIGHSTIPNLYVLCSESENLQKYKLNATPTTLVLNEEGSVEKVWDGLWNKSKVEEVNSYLNLSVQ